MNPDLDVVDISGLGLLRWVRESRSSSKAPHRGRFMCWMGRGEHGKGKEKKGKWRPTLVPAL